MFFNKRREKRVKDIAKIHSQNQLLIDLIDVGKQLNGLSYQVHRLTNSNIEIKQDEMKIKAELLRNTDLYRGKSIETRLEIGSPIDDKEISDIVTKRILSLDWEIVHYIQNNKNFD